MSFSEHGSDFLNYLPSTGTTPKKSDSVSYTGGLYFSKGGGCGEKTKYLGASSVAFRQSGGSWIRTEAYMPDASITENGYTAISVPKGKGN